MRKLFLSLLLCTGVINALACTNFIVGKKASADGSVMCTYSADDYGMFLGLCHYPAGKHAKGEMLQIYDWDTKEYHGQIPQAAETYNVIGNINEYQVTIGETTFGGREEMVDTTGILDYGSLIYIALQRSKTAREAISVMTRLVETYGFCSEGETFTICDPNEAWIMEMMGKGPGSKGVVWVAVRIPDDAICAHANQSRIRTFDQKDKKNVMFSKDCIKFARSKGWFTGKDKDFSFCDVYAAPTFSGRRACEARVWSFFNCFGDMDKYLPYVEGKVKETPDYQAGEYRFRTPDRWIFSVAGVGQNFLISADYELTNYKRMNLSDVDGYDMIQTEGIKSDFGMSGTLKVGAEYKVTPQFSVRAGTLWRTSPMKQHVKDGIAAIDPKTGEYYINAVDVAGTIPNYTVDKGMNSYSVGVGYRFTPSFYADLACVYREYKEDAYAFPSTFNPDGSVVVKSDPASLKTKTTQVALTLGYKF